MEEVSISETSVSLCQTTRRNIPAVIFILGEISGSHGGRCEDGCLLGCCAPYSGRCLPTFQRCLLPLSSGPPALTTRRSNLEDSRLRGHTRGCRNLKAHRFDVVISTRPVARWPYFRSVFGCELESDCLHTCRLGALPTERPGPVVDPTRKINMSQRMWW
jgi:hypothetical protein